MQEIISELYYYAFIVLYFGIAFIYFNGAVWDLKHSERPFGASPETHAQRRFITGFAHGLISSIFLYGAWFIICTLFS